jgi:hypothetical protein
MKHCLMLLIWLTGLKGFTQNYYNDAQLWFNFYLEKKLSKRFDIHLNQQDRWNQNITQYNLGYADVGLTIRLSKNVKILADYVYSEKRKKLIYFRPYHQFYIALSLKKDIRRWRFIYRNMVQVQYNDPFGSKTGYIPFYRDRNKFTIKYELTKRIDLYTATEFYIPLNLPNRLFYVDRIRYFIGTFITTFKHQQLEFYFMDQQQLQNNTWFTQRKRYPNIPLKNFFVYGIGYSYIF